MLAAGLKPVTCFWRWVRRWLFIPPLGCRLPPGKPELKLVIINRDPTDFDHVADLVINRSLGETLGEVDKRIKAMGE